VTERDDGWRAFRVAGQVDLSVIGILARISRILAGRGISISALSTFDTDYIMLKADKLDAAVAALAEHGYSFDRE
jgi:hypothetical protein